MPKKYEKGTPKDIANKTKSKGMQKLRWFVGADVLFHLKAASCRTFVFSADPNFYFRETP
jgi:hypothetical protein